MKNSGQSQALEPREGSVLMSATARDEWLGLISRPAACRLRPDVLGVMTGPQKTLLPLAAKDCISPSGKRVLVAATLGPTTKVRLDVWDTERLVRVAHIGFDRLGQEIRDPLDGNSYRMLKAACFLDEDHMALGLASGRLRIVSLSQIDEKSNSANTDNWEARVGDCIVELARSSTQLAVSVFPARDGRAPDHNSVGVKLYSIEDLVERRCFEPTRVLGYEPFEGIPTTLVFTPDARLIAQGQFLKGRSYEIWVRVVDIEDSSSRSIYRRTSTETDSSVSNTDEAGRFIIADSDHWSLYDSELQLVRQAQAPGIRPIEVSLTKTGRTAVARAFGAKVIRWDLTKDEEEPRVFLQNRSPLHNTWLESDSRLLSTLVFEDSYELIDISLEKGGAASTRRLSVTRSRIEPLRAQTYDIDIEGRLCVGDLDGRLRVFDSDLRQRNLLAVSSIPLRAVLSHPSRSRVAVMSYSGKVLWVDSTNGVLSPHYAPDGSVIDHGSGRQVLQFTPEGEVYFGGWSQNRYSWLADGLLWVWHPDRIWAWRMEQGPMRETGFQMAEVHNFSLPWRCLAATSLHDRPLCLSSDGRLISLDPERYELEAIHRPGEDVEQRLVLEGTPLLVLVEGIRSPGGFRRLDDDRLVLWTAKDVRILRLSPKLEVTEICRAAATGVLDVRHDPFSRRLVFCHGSHLSFWSERLEERFRLYLLADGGALIHVPFPESCRGAGCETHPGYFRYEPPDRSSSTVAALAAKLIEVLDQNGNPIDDDEACWRYLSSFFRDDLVSTAVVDYDGFVEILGWSRARRRKPQAKPALLPAWREQF